MSVSVCLSVNVCVGFVQLSLYDRSAFEMMKTVYEIRLKLSGADNPDFLETEVACFDSAVMIMLVHSQTAADAEYSAKVCAWATDAVKQALTACKDKLTVLSKGPKKFREGLQQNVLPHRKEYLERTQFRLQSLKPESHSTPKKEKKMLYLLHKTSRESL